jgi:hypothetical protein
MASSGMLRRVALVRTDVSEELSTSFIKMTRIREDGIPQSDRRENPLILHSINWLGSVAKT